MCRRAADYTVRGVISTFGKRMERLVFRKGQRA